MFNRFGSPAAVTICALVLLIALSRSALSQNPPQGPSTSPLWAAAPVFPKVFTRDVVVSNTDRDLKNSDMFFNSEPGIAINPVDPQKIVISAFSGSWTPLANSGFQNAPIWYTKNGGGLWTKEFTIPVPPGVSAPAVAVSPCDETFDYGRDGVLYGTFLLSGAGEEGASCSSFESSSSGSTGGDGVYSGGTSDPSTSLAWQWFVTGGKTQPTNQFPPDQPWLIVSKNPAQPAQDRVYVGYQGVDSAMHVAVAKGRLPLDFTTEHSPGPRLSLGINPGLRVAANHRSGAIYSLYQQTAQMDCPEEAEPVSYIVNRSLDGGLTWALDGKPHGISVAQVCSHQNLARYGFGAPEPPFLGGANHLKGGVDAIAVDSKTGDVYVVYGNFDQKVSRDRLSIVRLIDLGDKGIELGKSHFVSGPEHQSALPGVAVAVTKNGDTAVGVLYDTADGLDPITNRPYFSAHLALSRDYGITFEDVVLQTFLLPENAPAGALSPRPLGDYQQLKSFENTFYGVFTGDGEPFGRPFHKIDPIFVKTSVTSRSIDGN